VPQILVLNPAVQARTLPEFVALAKSKPGQIDYASSGTGSAPHLAMEIFADMAGISLHHVPYKGTSPGLNDVMSGQVSVCFDAIAPVLGYVKAGRVRALGVVRPQRVASLPDVPTFAESGFPKYTFASWFGIYAPARTPRVIVEKLNGELVKILQRQETRERFERLGIDTVGSTPEELAKHLRTEIAQYSATVRQHNIRGE